MVASANSAQIWRVMTSKQPLDPADFVDRAQCAARVLGGSTGRALARTSPSSAAAPTHLSGSVEGPAAMSSITEDPLGASQIHTRNSGRSPAWRHVVSTVTWFEWRANAWRSSGSPVRTVPPGSATATNTASTADPFRARCRSSASAPGGQLGQLVDDVTCLEQSVRVGIETRTTGGGFDQHDRRNQGRPQPFAAECGDGRRVLLVALGQSGDGAAVEDQHRSTCPLRIVRAEAPRDRFGSGQLVGRRLTDFLGELGQVRVGLVEQRVATQFSSDRLLEQLGCGQTALLQLVVEIVWQVDLKPRYTPNYTHTWC